MIAWSRAAELDLTELDPFGEWINPEVHGEVRRVLAEFQRDNVGFEASVGHIRLHRPNQGDGANAARKAQLFWSNPESKAHLLNALLRRGTMKIQDVQSEQLQIPAGKIYTYLNNAGIQFTARPRVGVRVRAMDGNVFDAEIADWDSKDVLRASLRVAGVSEPLAGRWSASDRLYRLLEPIPACGAIQTKAVSAALDVSEGVLLSALKLSGIRVARVPVEFASRLQRLRSERVAVAVNALDAALESRASSLWA